MGGRESVKFSKPSSRNKIIFGVLAIAVLAVILGLAIGIPLSQRDSGGDGNALNDNQKLALKVLNEYPLIDGHNDLPYRYRAYAKNQMYSVNLAENLTVRGWEVHQTNIPMLRQGHVGGQFWVAFAFCSGQYKDIVRQSMDQVDIIKRMINLYPDVFEYTTTAQGILDAFNGGKIASLIALEGGHSIDSSLGLLRLYYELGVRYMTVTHSCNTPCIPCDCTGGGRGGSRTPNHISSKPKSLSKIIIRDREESGSDIVTYLLAISHIRADNWKVDEKDYNGTKLNGLTDFGKLVVKEMNRLGMMVDLSHVAHKTMLDAIEVSTAPVIFSHSSAFTYCNHYRNVQDDVLNKTKENKGVVMVNFYDKHINCKPNFKSTATLSQVADHIDYIKNLIGVDYVGIGADYDGVSTMPVGLADASKYPDLFAELARRGWTEENLKKLAGGNLIRVFKKVEEVRDSLKSTQPIETRIDEAAVVNETCRTDF